MSNLLLKLCVLVGALFLVACDRQEIAEGSGFVGGDYAYVARGRELHVVEIKRPDRPRWVATVDVPGRVMKVQVSGNQAYVVHTPSVDSWVGNPPDGGLQIVDVSRPKRPRIVGYYHAANLAQDVAVVDQVAYLADWDGLHVLDIRVTSDPIELMTLTDGLNGLTVSGDRLYGTWGSCSMRTPYCEGGVWAADITDPQQPRPLGTFHHAETPGYDIALQGDLAYVAGLGVWQIDMSEATNMKLRVEHKLREGRYQTRLAVADAHLYLITEKGLRVFTIAHDTQLLQVALLPLTAFVSDITVRGDYAYLVSNEGLHVIDIGDPQAPQIVGYYSGPS